MKDAFKARVFTFLGGGKANIYDFEVNQLGPIFRISANSLGKKLSKNVFDPFPLRVASI